MGVDQAHVEEALELGRRSGARVTTVAGPSDAAAGLARALDL